MGSTNKFLSEFKALKIPIPGVRLPSFIVEEKYLKEFNLKKDTSNFEFFRALCIKGFKNLNFKKDSKEYKEYGQRIKYELDILNELGFVDYILLVWDVSNFCNEKNIPTGMGRG